MNAQPPQQVADELKKAGEGLDAKVIGTFLKQARVAMVADVRDNFRGSSDPDGAPWKPLARPRIRGGALPLLDTGLLRASVTANGTGHVEAQTATSLTIGTALPYAAIHQYGGTILPTTAKALAIPQTREALRAGSPRNFAEPLTLLWPKGKSAGVLVQAKTKGRGKKKTVVNVVQYVLVHSVTIPARPFLGFGERLIKRLGDIAARVLQVKWGGSNGA